MTGRVQGKVALVTGGASGLGQADCVLLAREGARVIVTDIDEQGANRVADSLGGMGKALRHDVADEADWSRICSAIEKEFGGLDILVNNAGIVIPETVEQTSLANFRKTMAIHAEGVFLGCHHGIALMAGSGGGSIINMSSAAALLGYSVFFAYAAAKGAIRAMSKSVAMHCQEQGYGIRCNVIFPGGIETPMVQAFQGRLGKSVAVPEGVLPAEALGAAEDVARMVLYLASDESRFVTGAEMVIDNGAWIRP